MSRRLPRAIAGVVAGLLAAASVTGCVPAVPPAAYAPAGLAIDDLPGQYDQIVAATGGRRFVGFEARTGYEGRVETIWAYAMRAEKPTLWSMGEQPLHEAEAAGRLLRRDAVGELSRDTVVDLTRRLREYRDTTRCPLADVRWTALPGGHSALSLTCSQDPNDLPDHLWLDGSPVTLPSRGSIGDGLRDALRIYELVSGTPQVSDVAIDAEPDHGRFIFHQAGNGVTMDGEPCDLRVSFETDLRVACVDHWQQPAPPPATNLVEAARLTPAALRRIETDQPEGRRFRLDLVYAGGAAAGWKVSSNNQPDILYALDGQRR